MCNTKDTILTFGVWPFKSLTSTTAGEQFNLNAHDGTFSLSEVSPPQRKKEEKKSIVPFICHRLRARFTLEKATKTQTGSRCIPLLFL